MTAKEYLSRARTLDKQTDVKHERVMRLRALAEKRTTSYGETVGGGTWDRYDLVDEIVDQGREIDEDIDRLLALRREIEATIRTVPEDRLRLVLEHRYLTKDTWEAIAEKLYYDERHVRRIHNRALEVITCPGMSGSL